VFHESNIERLARQVTEAIVRVGDRPAVAAPRPDESGVIDAVLVGAAADKSVPSANPVLVPS
jgi:hypothetical protein